jgi:S1-C subfamily serine protease
MGDILVGANGRAFAGPDDLADAIEQNAGATLLVEFVRGDVQRTREVSVRLERKAPV